MNEQDANFDVKNIVPVDLRLLNGQVNLILICSKYDAR